MMLTTGAHRAYIVVVLEQLELLDQSSWRAKGKCRLRTRPIGQVGCGGVTPRFDSPARHATRPRVI